MAWPGSQASVSVRPLLLTKVRFQHSPKAWQKGPTQQCNWTMLPFPRFLPRRLVSYDYKSKLVLQRHLAGSNAPLKLWCDQTFQRRCRFFHFFRTDVACPGIAVAVYISCE